MEPPYRSSRVLCLCVCVCVCLSVCCLSVCLSVCLSLSLSPSLLPTLSLPLSPRVCFTKIEFTNNPLVRVMRVEVTQKEDSSSLNSTTFRPPPSPPLFPPISPYPTPPPGFCKWHNYNNNNNNNNNKIIIIIIIIAFKGAIRDFLQSPHSAANCLQHVRSSGPGAIVCKSRATHRALITCKCHATCHLVRRDSSAT